MRQPLDPKARALLTAFSVAQPPDLYNIPISFARSQVENGFARLRIPCKPVGSIIDRTIPGVNQLNIRIYTPSDSAPDLPVILFFHGGGWIFFDLDAYDPFCTYLCEASRCLVVSVSYRRSPEHKFPDASDDCLAALRWTAENIGSFGGDPQRIFVAGDSAGGNLAAVTSLRVRDQGGPRIRGQVLFYPVTDYCEPEKPSYREFFEGFGLSMADLKWFWNQYLASETDAANPYVAPLLAENLSGLPDTFVMVAGYDPLRDEGIAFANRLTEHGVKVTLSVYGDMIHSFISYLGILKQAEQAINEAAAWIRQTAAE